MRAVTGPATPATLVTLATLATLATLVAAAASSQQQDVIATLSSSPVLPCAFPSGDDLLVHWMKDGSKTPVVHSYYKGQDQGDHQLEQFRGRTSLFHEQLSQGNASLLLERVRVPDRGRYTCYTSNSRGRQESFVNLEVEAPVTEVSIAEEGDRISCRSEGIYPRPQVTWSRSLSADTSIEPTEQQLFSVRSSVPRSEDQTDFTCRVAGLRSSRSATLTTAGHLEVTGTEETLQCSALKPPLTSIAWRVNGSLIVQGQVHNASERWRVHVKELSTSGSLTLQKLSPDLSGVYSCEVVNEDETRVKVIRVTIAAVQTAQLLEGPEVPCGARPSPLETMDLSRGNQSRSQPEKGQHVRGRTSLRLKNPTTPQKQLLSWSHSPKKTKQLLALSSRHQKTITLRADTSRSSAR
ncbi:uncharacterized protein ACB057_017617 [Neosynchiropus ocellatus]